MISNRLIPLVFLVAFATLPAGARVEGDEPGATSEERETQPQSEADTDVPEPSGDIDEMVVLARGRDDFLKDMTISSTSFSAAEIKSLRIQNTYSGPSFNTHFGQSDQSVSLRFLTRNGGPPKRRWTAKTKPSPRRRRGGMEFS